VREGRTVGYRSLAKSPSGATLLKTSSKPTANPLIPDYTVEDPRTGLMLRARPVAGGVELRHREKRGAKTERKIVKPPSPAVNGAGLPVLLGRRLEQLAAGRTVAFALTAPSRLDWYRFQAVGKGRRKVGGVETVVVVVKPQSRFLRVFAGEMRFFIAPTTRRVMRYEGIANVRDDDGDRYKVRLTYAR